MKNGTNRKNGSEQIQSASSLYQDGFRCSQAVLLAFSEGLGLNQEIALKISTGFGGGISRHSEVCGAVTGAVLVIGLKYGQKDLKDEKAKEITYYLVGEFIEKFKSRHGSINCKELINCDLGTPEGLKRFRDTKMNETVCKKFVEDAEEILEELIDYCSDMP